MTNLTNMFVCCNYHQIIVYPYTHQHHATFNQENPLIVRRLQFLHMQENIFDLINSILFTILRFLNDGLNIHFLIWYIQLKIYVTKASIRFEFHHTCSSRKGVYKTNNCEYWRKYHADPIWIMSGSYWCVFWILAKQNPYFILGVAL